QEFEAATHRQVQHNHAGDLRTRLNEARSRLEQALEQLQSSSKAAGLTTEPRLETSFLLWARQLHDWQQADQTVAGHKQALEHDRSAQAASRKQAVKLLAHHGFELTPKFSSRDLAAILHQLAPRMRTSAELHNEIQAHHHRIGELEADIDMLRQRRQQLFAQISIGSDDRETLVKRIDQHEEWRQLEHQRRAASLEIARLEQRLGTDTALLEQARKQQRDELTQQHQSLAEKVDRRDELNRRSANIHTRHEDLLDRSELWTLTGEFEHPRAALATDSQVQ